MSSGSDDDPDAVDSDADSDDDIVTDDDVRTDDNVRTNDDIGTNDGIGTDDDARADDGSRTDDGVETDWEDDVELTQFSAAGDSDTTDPEVGGSDTIGSAADSDGTSSDSDGPISAADSDADADVTTTGAAAATAETDTAEPTARIRAAIDEVRREVRKAAVLHAAVEAALLALLANLVLSLVAPSILAGAIGLPGVVVATLRALPLLDAVVPRTVDITSLVAVALGIVAFAGAYLFRLRRPLIEQFEAANPSVREALRTARDAVDDDTDTEMARRLYDDVIATLGGTSSLELVETRRVAVTIALVVLVSLASVQVAVVNPDLAGLLAGQNGADTVEPPADDDLQDGDQILGDSEDVQAGDDLENISVPGTGEGSADGPTGPGDGYVGGGSGSFDSQQAGFSGAEDLEDAELVREYNLRIREFDEGGDDTDGTS